MSSSCARMPLTPTPATCSVAAIETVLGASLEVHCEVCVLFIFLPTNSLLFAKGITVATGLRGETPAG